jgi:hypothetical protein
VNLTKKQLLLAKQLSVFKLVKTREHLRLVKTWVPEEKSSSESNFPERFLSISPDLNGHETLNL